MAMTVPHDGQRPQGPAKKHPAGHHQPGHHQAPPKPKTRGGAGKVMLILGAIVLAGAGAWIAFGPKGDGLTTDERLLKQMHDAATGSVVATHAFNGELSVTRGERGLNVVAKGLPSKACVSVAWRLAREGTVIVNGTMPMRISAGRLTELCADTEGGSTLTWVPEQQ